jgi:hypothetical protein
MAGILCGLVSEQGQAGLSGRHFQRSFIRFACSDLPRTGELCWLFWTAPLASGKRTTG